MADGVCENWEVFSENSELLDKEVEKLRNQKLRNENDGVGFISGEREKIDSGESTQPQFRILLRNKNPITNDGIKMECVVGGSKDVVVFDSTTEDSLRTPYTPPQPTLKILSRPKNHKPKESPKPLPPPSINSRAESNDSDLVNEKKSTKTLKQREKEYSEARMRILGDVRFLKEEEEAALESTLTPAEILKLKISKCLAEDNDKDSLPVLEDKIKEKEEGDDTTTAIDKKKNRKKRTKTKTPNLNLPPPIHFPPSKIESDRILRQPKGPDGTPGFNSPR